MLLKFGDIFRYKEKEYVYLIKQEEITYAAEIYNEEISQDLKHYRETSAKKGKPDSPLFSFVILTIPEYKGRAAGVGNSDKNDGFTEDYPKKIVELPEEDMGALKNEIIGSKGVPIALRDYVKSL